MFNNIKEIINRPTQYTGSQKTYDMVADEIKRRWGEKELKNYDPMINARTFASWSQLGARIKKGEKAIKAYTYIDTRNPNDGSLIRRFRRNISVFYYKQVYKA